MDENLKECNGCHQIKKFSEYYERREKGKKAGLTSECRICMKRKNNSYYYRNQELQKARSKDYRDKNPHKTREWHLQCRFGITQDSYLKLLKKQKGVCAICGNPPTTKRLGVDHCHNTGLIRGLLCHHCNSGIGRLKDSIELLSKAKRYLKKYQQPKQ